ncbi:MAG: transketolase [Desulfobacteraceae bacterium]|jgi:transketolase
MKTDIKALEEKAKYIRQQILSMCCRAGTGHVNSSFSCTEIMVALYHGGIMRVEPGNPGWAGRDRFILSKGQASVILYPVLADLGFFPEEELDRFNAVDGKFGVHLQHDVPGVEITSGSLGHGLGVATGIALAAKMNRDSFLTFALLGDGECYEGSIWESAMFASHYRLNNLVAIVDRNHLCVTDFTENIVALEPFADKWRAFGWDVEEIDGHSFEEIFKALSGVRAMKSVKPKVVIADTVKGKGVSFLCNAPLWHGIAPSGELAKQAKSELGME